MLLLNEMNDKVIPPKQKLRRECKDYINIKYLLGDRKKLTIKHENEMYILQITKNNKLLLTK